MTTVLDRYRAKPKPRPRRLVCECGWAIADRFPELPIEKRRCGVCAPTEYNRSKLRYEYDDADPVNSSDCKLLGHPNVAGDGCPCRAR